MRHRALEGEGRGRDGASRRAALLLGTAAVCGAATLVAWPAGCQDDSNGTPTRPPCGVVDPATGEVPACGPGLFCDCGTHECAEPEATCATGYRVAEFGGLCLSPAQVARLVASTPEDHPACLEPDGGPDGEPDGGPDGDADADADGDADGDEDGDADAREDVAEPDVVEPDDAGPEDGEAGGPIELAIFSREEMYASPTDRRRISRDFGFPVARDYQRITVRFRVHTGCPTFCDPLARVATVRLGLDGGGEVELLRAVTPFGGDAEWTEDVTDLAPLLTWVHPVIVTLDTTEGGWEVDLWMTFEPGPPPREVLRVVPLFDHANYRVPADISPVLVRMPVGVAGAALRYRFTGHSTTGEGCDESCERTVTVSVDGAPRLEHTPWRTDCASFVAVNPLGDPAVVSRARSGWCPGDRVRTVVTDFTPWLSGLDQVFDMEIPEVDPATGSWRVSAVLVLYR